MVAMASWVAAAANAVKDVALRTWRRVLYACVILEAYVKLLYYGEGDCLIQARAFDEGTDVGGRRVVDVTRVVRRHPHDWEAGVRSHTRWTRFRVQLKFWHGGTVYRAVLRPGDEYPIPLPVRKRMTLPRGPVEAYLETADGDLIDIAARVRKYQGPSDDFFAHRGLRVAALDLFPMDDADEIAAENRAIIVVTAMGAPHRIPLDCPDLAAELKLR